MRAVALVVLLVALTSCRTTQQRNADIQRTGKACMAYVMDEHRAGRLTNAQAEYGLAKCESDANAAADIRYLSTRPR